MFNKMEDDNLISRINSALAFVLWTINTMVAIAIVAIAADAVVVVSSSGRRLFDVWLFGLLVKEML